MTDLDAGAWMHLPGEEDGRTSTRAHFFPGRGEPSLCRRWVHGQGLGDWTYLTAWPHHPATARHPQECQECDRELERRCGDATCEEPHP